MRIIILSKVAYARKKGSYAQPYAELFKKNQNEDKLIGQAKRIIRGRLFYQRLGKNPYVYHKRKSRR